MDVSLPCEEVSQSQELARESLISISYSLPEKIPSSDIANGIINGQVGLPVANGDGTDKYRSELISISYSHSPETTALPGVTGDPEP